MIRRRGGSQPPDRSALVRQPLQPDERLSEDLIWVTEVLWGHTPNLRVVVGGATPPGFACLAAWGVLPDRQHPRVLVPLSSPRAAAASMRQYSDGMGQFARLARALVGLGLRSGAVQWGLRRRGLTVRLGAIAGDGPASDGCLLPDHVANVLGRDDLESAIVLGPLRPNRKPVVQLLSRNGEVVAYMKVGWNDLTRRLVRNEAAMLARLADRAPQTFQPPRLLHHGRWEGLEIVICSALPHRFLRRGRRDGLPPLAVSREIADLGGTRRTALGASPYWRDLLSRLQVVRGRGTDRSRELLAVAQELVAARAETRLLFGTWHGDWGPWNTRAAGDRLLVWDWERSGDGVPVGFDVIHFYYQYQTAVGRRRQPAPQAGATTLRRATPALGQLGQPAGTEELLLILYLLERLCRSDEAAISAVTGRPQAAGAMLLDVLAHRVKEQRR
jgi:hypothetical protein